MRIPASDTALLEPETADAAQWPAQADLVLSALESGQHHGEDERRKQERQPYRTLLLLQLYSDPPAQAPWRLFTRDACSRSIGFITQHRLPLGYGGIARIKLPGDQVMHVPVTVNRCRPTAPGWFEGCLQLNRERPELQIDSADTVRGPRMVR